MISQSIVVFIFCLSMGRGDDIEMEMHSSLMLKMLREMANQTSAADSLNLPANSTSIRKNITDTFSCENRTYGYYADVDNDCQIFHICLPSQSSRGRNITYRWSFICPSETIFNQEVLTCTRPIDAIPCEESPQFYFVNEEFGKIPNNTKKEGENGQTNANKPQKRRPDNKKQNLIYDKYMQQFLEETMDDKIEDLGANNDNVENIFPILDVPSEIEPLGIVNRDKIIIDEDRLVMERGSDDDAFGFRADV